MNGIRVVSAGPFPSGCSSRGSEGANVHFYLNKLQFLDDE